jgi:DNA gyrase/topoisomerase IV subunit B
MEVQASLAWTQSYTETLLSYVNSVPTSDGGTHEAGFKAALTKAVDDYARQAKLVKDKAPNVEGEDVRE